MIVPINPSLDESFRQPFAVLKDDGKELGRIEYSHYTDCWFAKFPLGTAPMIFAMGHGDTPAKAACVAIEQTAQDLKTASNQLDCIRQSLTCPVD